MSVRTDHGIDLSPPISGRGRREEKLEKVVLRRVDILKGFGCVDDHYEPAASIALGHDWTPTAGTGPI